MASVTIKQHLRNKALSMNGVIESDLDPRIRSERLTFVNDIDEVQRNKLKEYNVWYSGDSDELMNFYTRATTIDYNMDPLYNRNKKGYFWAVASLESDVKRTHSGQPRNIVDTLVSIVGVPHIYVGSPDNTVLRTLNNTLQQTLEDNSFSRTLMQKARPMTLYEGWGAWKINWDSSFRDTPILLYYRAESVDFIYKSNQIVAIIYQDYYQDKDKHNYVLFETRRLSTEETETVDPETGKTLKTTKPCLIIEKELFKLSGDSQYLTPAKLSDLPQLRDVKERIKISNFNRFLGCPCIIYEDNTGDCYGRSIFTGKIDMFDDLDQCLSQAANTVRRSTAHEYFDVQYLEKDENGLPIMPKDFDRKYIKFTSVRGADGMSNSSPVQVTQPRLDFTQYSAEEQNILVHCISGIMSPATLGIDIAKKDNAEAQREKEKVTIFTRNVIMEEEGKWLKTLANDILVADELMRTGVITCRKYDVSVKYDEFADASFEAKMETVLNAWQAGIMSDELAVEYLHKDSGDELKARELKYIKDTKAAQQQAQMSPEDMGMFGELGAENDYNTQHEKADIAGDLAEMM